MTQAPPPHPAPATREQTHAAIGSHLHTLRQTLNELIAIRVREHGDLLEQDEGELFALMSSFQFLMSDLQAERAKAAA